jgi:hypothetical protein
MPVNFVACYHSVFCMTELPSWAAEVKSDFSLTLALVLNLCSFEILGVQIGQEATDHPGPGYRCKNNAQAIRY